MRNKSNLEKSTSNLSLFLYSLIAVFLQLGIFTYFSPYVGTDTLLWSYVYKAFWLSCLGLALYFVALRPGTISAIWQVLLCICAGIFLISLSGFTDLSKNLTMTGVTLATLLVIISGAGVDRCLKFCSHLTVVSAIYILIEINFLDGFSNTAGRAAGLYENPNIAATALMLSALPASQAVAMRYQVSYWLLIGAAIATTLSRSTLISLAAISMVYGLSMLCLGRLPHAIEVAKASFKSVAITLLILAAVFMSAVTINPRFRLALSTADIKINYSFVSEGQSGRIQDSLASGESAAEPPGIPTTQKIDKHSSEGERLQLLEKAFAEFRKSPFMGIGLESSYRLRPHNTYLLFAVAYGFTGLLIPLGILSIFFWGRTPLSLAMGTGLGLAMFFSHDILLMPVYIIPIALALVCTLNKSSHISSAATSPSYVPSQIALLMAVAFVMWINVGVALDSPKQLREKVDPTLLSGVNVCSYVYEPKMLQANHFFTIDAWLNKLVSPSNAIQLFEDGKQVKWSSRQADPDAEQCDGRFATTEYWGVVFSASDGSDPRTSSHTYEVIYFVTTHPLIPILLVLLIIWTVYPGLQKGRRSESSQ